MVKSFSVWRRLENSFWNVCAFALDTVSAKTFCENSFGNSIISAQPVVRPCFWIFDTNSFFGPCRAGQFFMPWGLQNCPHAEGCKRSKRHMQSYQMWLLGRLNRISEYAMIFQGFWWIQRVWFVVMRHFFNCLSQLYHPNLFHRPSPT